MAILLQRIVAGVQDSNVVDFNGEHGSTKDVSSWGWSKLDSLPFLRLVIVDHIYFVDTVLKVL
jgi:hypothetical protein